MLRRPVVHNPRTARTLQRVAAATARRRSNGRHCCFRRHVGGTLQVSLSSLRQSLFDLPNKRVGVRRAREPRHFLLLFLHHHLHSRRRRIQESNAAAAAAFQKPGFVATRPAEQAARLADVLLFTPVPRQLLLALRQLGKRRLRLRSRRTVAGRKVQAALLLQPQTLAAHPASPLLHILLLPEEALHRTPVRRKHLRRRRRRRPRTRLFHLRPLRRLQQLRRVRDRAPLRRIHDEPARHLRGPGLRLVVVLEVRDLQAGKRAALHHPFLPLPQRQQGHVDVAAFGGGDQPLVGAVRPQVAGRAAVVVQPPGSGVRCLGQPCLLRLVVLRRVPREERHAGHVQPRVRRQQPVRVRPVACGDAPARRSPRRVRSDLEQRRLEVLGQRVVELRVDVVADAPRRRGARHEARRQVAQRHLLLRRVRRRRRQHRRRPRQQPVVAQPVRRRRRRVAPRLLDAEEVAAQRRRRHAHGHVGSVRQRRHQHADHAAVAQHGAAADAGRKRLAFLALHRHVADVVRARTLQERRRRNLRHPAPHDPRQHLRRQRQRVVHLMPVHHHPCPDRQRPAVEAEKLEVKGKAPLVRSLEGLHLLQRLFGVARKGAACGGASRPRLACGCRVPEGAGAVEEVVDDGGRRVQGDGVEVPQGVCVGQVGDGREAVRRAVAAAVRGVEAAGDVVFAVEVDERVGALTAEVEQVRVAEGVHDVVRRQHVEARRAGHVSPDMRHGEPAAVAERLRLAGGKGKAGVRLNVARVPLPPPRVPRHRLGQRRVPDVVATSLVQRHRASRTRGLLKGRRRHCSGGGRSSRGGCRRSVRNGNGACGLHSCQSTQAPPQHGVLPPPPLSPNARQ
eukprot:Rhum_TRINITY_DN15024_c26_g1::Rhum_TRINITY_DN15024_c26_g1_i1::g.133943::m.133943